MPLIERAGRKSLRIRLTFTVIYFFLIIGSITMVYPFLIMLASSITSTVDYDEYKIIPRYLFDEKALFYKVINDKYNKGWRGSKHIIRLQYSQDFTDFQEMPFPTASSAGEIRRLQDWRVFTTKLPERYWKVGFCKANYETGRIQKKYRRWVLKKYNGSLDKINTTYLTSLKKISDLSCPQENLLIQSWIPERNIYYRDFTEFRKTLNHDDMFIASVDGLWQRYLKGKFKNNIKAFNSATNLNYKSFNTLFLPSSLKNADKIDSLWSEFVQKKLSPRYWEFSKISKESFKTYYVNTRGSLPNDVEEFLDNKITIDETDREFASSSLAWIKNPSNVKIIKLDTPGILYRRFLKNKYKLIDTLNSAYSTQYRTFRDVGIPNQLLDVNYVTMHTADWRWYFLTTNYVDAFAVMSRHGGALLNTFVFCLAIVIATLTVNPMCAYALSRFNLSYSNKIMMFLLATMAFPAEVAMIPNFLLLKDLGILNTYMALILPSLANGYAIFYLKGFFDSLPKELYEAATIDGASEMTIFFKITMPLASPILAYLALGAFTGAYQAFMFAVIVCPDPSKWTIMVFLYDMANWTTPSMQMAAFVIASIPTLLIFILAQGVIMRGIVIPIEK